MKGLSKGRNDETFTGEDAGHLTVALTHWIGDNRKRS